MFYLLPRRRPIYGFALAFFLAGCSGVKLEPVEGKALVDGQPLAHGSFQFKPDASKGNKSTLEPVGLVETPGVYKMYTDKKPGAPAGWYKVVATAVEPVDPKDPYAPRKVFISDKYGLEQTTDLTIEIVPNPTAGAYDLNMKK